MENRNKILQKGGEKVAKMATRLLALFSLALKVIGRESSSGLG